MERPFEKWAALVSVTPELLQDPVALGAMLEMVAPRDSVYAVVTRYAISPRHQDPDSRETVIQICGRAVRAT